MNALTQKVLDVVKEYSHFPGPIVQSQTKRIGKTVDDLSNEDLPSLSEAIGRAIANFTNPAKGDEIKRRIAALR